MDMRSTPARPAVDLSGDSPRMQALRDAVRRLAEADAPVLVQGETGTGKEQVARALHQQSHRAAWPFVVVHCGGATAALFAAGSDVLSAATGGTLFLDAVDELPSAAQGALLRLLQDADAGAGAAAPHARLVAATHLEAEELAAPGRLRQDLVHRLAALRLQVPALRDRREDLPGLAAQFLREFAQGRELRLSDAAAAALVLHAWPGNVRELRNRLSQAVLLDDGGALTPERLGLPAPGRPHGLSLREMRQAAEREAITRALRKSQGQVPAAAALLGISRAQLYRLISRLRLDHHAVADTVDRVARPTPAARVAEPEDSSRAAS